MLVYHGTGSAIAQALASGNVNVRIGGGELGRGFYTGELLHLAKRWAIHRHRTRQKNVVQFDVPDTAITALHFELLNGPEATLQRDAIRRSDTTRTHVFGCDMVWSPIAGNESIVGEQHKWESRLSERLLNGPSVARAVV